MSPAENHETVSAAEGPVPASAGPAGSVSPLDRYLVPRSLLEAADPAVEQAREDEVERRVAECMAERGFTYLPVLGRAWSPGPAARDEPEPDSRAWAERWGYGIATTPPGRGPADDDRDPDPNHAIAAALDPDRRRAYERALYGRAFDGSAEPEPGGARAAAVAGLDAACRTIAIRAVHGGTPSRTLTWPGGLDPWADRARLDDAAHQHPRVVAALADWSRRLAGAGHPGFADLDGPATAIAERRSRIAAGGVDAEALARLARDEVALAVADWDARQASGVVATMIGIRWQFEREYVDANRDVLEAHRAALRAAD